MAHAQHALSINPGKGLGFLCMSLPPNLKPESQANLPSTVLGACLHDILTRIKSQPHRYPKIDVIYSPDDPVNTPVAVSLPQNGIRLRFDGPDQRLRLIEVVDFGYTQLVYKNIDLVKLPGTQRVHGKTPGPTFRHVYNKLFGPTFAGEYLSSETSKAGEFSDRGTYVLSYPGLAFSFPLQKFAWSPEKDFVTLLSSSAASTAVSLAIFSGSSWKEARQDLYNGPCPHPRSTSLTGKGREFTPDEVELVTVRGQGLMDLHRRSSPPFKLQLGITTPQDLVAELGPPDAIHRKHDRRLSIHKKRGRSRSDQRGSFSGCPGRLDGTPDTERSSAVTSADESDSDEDANPGRYKNQESNPECFYNYFDHGFDAFISYPHGPSPHIRPTEREEIYELKSNQPAVTKILLHGNVPGSYPFNRYRRCRWVLDFGYESNGRVALNSETSFKTISSTLDHIWKDTYHSEDDKTSLQRGMVLNRGWGDSPGSSIELLGGWEEASDVSKADPPESAVEAASSTLGNTELFGFQGLLFEVLKNDAISCLTIY